MVNHSNAFTITGVPSAGKPIKILTEIRKAANTTKVANPPTKAFGKRFPNNPLITNPIKGSKTIAYTKFSICIILLIC